MSDVIASFPVLLAPLFPGMEFFVFLGIFLPWIAAFGAIIFGSVVARFIPLGQFNSQTTRVALAMLLILSLLVTIVTALQPISESTAEKISPGMSAIEVTQLVGRPHQRTVRYDGTETWIYYCDWSQLLVCGVDFDEDQRVVKTLIWAD